MESRRAIAHTRRRRECLNPDCKNRYSTWEVLFNPVAVQAEDLETEASVLADELAKLQTRLYRLKIKSSGAEPKKTLRDFLQIDPKK
jgi:transcriptional regulator NrdR family protein